MQTESGWTALEIAGTLAFTMTGILAAFAIPLAKSGISIFSISTFDTDYIRGKTLHPRRTMQALSAVGHRLLDTVPK